MHDLTIMKHLVKTLAICIMFASIMSCSTETTDDTSLVIDEPSDSVQLSQAPPNQQIHTKKEQQETTTVIITKDDLLGRINPQSDQRFIKMADAHSSAAMYLRKETNDAFAKMHEAAKADGVNLKVISATRPFAHQKRIWEGKWTGARKSNGRNLAALNLPPVERALDILQWSSMPGTSRHHWGTDIDINDLNNSYFEETKKGKAVYEWLTAHAADYGFCQPYSPKTNEAGDTIRTGYNEEKWHWSYRPISDAYTLRYKEMLSNADITGFKGSETAEQIDVLNNYVLGIRGGCSH